ncbi:hypothetical protein TNCV_2274921 [Trichonephila clavipes]|nr:hypothetical protein TNCV_2274921 [Trichonephila clavipes]
MQINVTTERDPCLNPDSSASKTVSFIHVELVISSVLFSRNKHKPSITLHGGNLHLSIKSTEAYCCLVQGTCFLAQRKLAFVSTVGSGSIHNWLPCVETYIVKVSYHRSSGDLVPRATK